jgi:hypothetical protein
MQMRDPLEPSKVTVVGFLAVMAIVTSIWIGL